MTDRDRTYSYIKIRDTWVALEEFRRKREWYDKLVTVSFVAFCGAMLMLALRLI